MSSCPEFYCTVVTDFYYLFMLQDQHSYCPPLKHSFLEQVFHLWTYGVNYLCYPSLQPDTLWAWKTRCQAPDVGKGPQKLLQGGKKPKDIFSLQLLFQTMKHHLILCKEVVHRVELIWSGHLLSNESHKRKIAMCRALNDFEESNWNCTDCGCEVSTSLSFTIKGM